MENSKKKWLRNLGNLKEKQGEIKTKITQNSKKNKNGGVQSKNCRNEPKKW